jgi:hypothetical protein
VFRLVRPPLATLLSLAALAIPVTATAQPPAFTGPVRGFMFAGCGSDAASEDR